MNAKFKTSAGVHVPSVDSIITRRIELTAERDVGLSEAMITENAGRNIAQFILPLIGTGTIQGKASSFNSGLGGSRRISPMNRHQVPKVIVLAGNHRTGAYAICAARHLLNHHVQVYLVLPCHPTEIALVRS